MTAAQKDMVARPDAVVVGTGCVIMVVVIMVMGMTMGVPMCVPVRMIVKAMVVRHGVSLAPSGRKSAPVNVA
jgi:hypothetical protein